jgi:eukaryotic-like serine/threonine-protein kinase
MAQFSSDEWRSLSEYLDQALDLEPTARAHWLAELRQSRPDIAERVAVALAVAAQPGFLDRGSLFHDRPTAAGTLVGRRVGPYVIEAEIGRGGMGSVWRARRADGRYDGTVAIKFVHAAWIGRAGEQRFRIEGTLLGRLDHPHIARLLDAGVLDATQPYLILEHVEGEPIDSYCRRHRLDVESRVKLFLDVLAAVAHAHSHLIVHRDIKPGNIFVTRDGVVKLLDFGIAKLLDDDSGSGTRSGAAALTPLYAAPEQLLGQPVSTATDVYALGLVLYVLLTGSHPISNADSNAKLVNAVAMEIPPPASSVATVETVPGGELEGDLDNILHKALKKDPVERYSTVGAFAEDLQRFLTHQPVQARADTLRYRTQKFVQRHRGGVAAGLLFAMAVILGFIGTLWQAHRADLNARQADAARAHALEQLRYSEASTEFLSFLLQRGSEKPYTTPELLTRGEAIVNAQFKDDPALRARLLLTMANLYAEVEDKSKAQALYLAAQAAAHGARDVVLNAQIDCGLALEYADLNQFDKALGMLDQAIARARSATNADPAVIADCLDKRAQVDWGSGDPTRSLVDAKAALATLGVPSAAQRTLDLSIRTTLAAAHAMLGNRAAAVQEYTRAIEELEQMGRQQTDFAVTVLNGLGVVLSRSGQWLRAARIYERGLNIERAEAGNAEISPMTQINYAKLLVDLGREREALPLFDSAMASARHRGDANAVAMGDLLSAPALCAVNDLDECAARLARSGEALRRQLPPGHPILATQETELAQLAVQRRQRDQARTHLSAALGIFRAGNEHNPNALRALAIQAELDLENNDLAAAQAHSDELVTAARAELGGFAGSAWLGRALLVQGEVLRARGKAVEARSVLERALEMLRSCVGESAPWTLQARAELAR